MPKAATERRTIEYVILERVDYDGDLTWAERGTWTSTDARAAIREFFDRLAHADAALAHSVSTGTATVVAVPTRFFRPMTLRMETRTQLILDEAASPIFD